ncbi:hypothetical protein Tco_0030062, partial [Tanacetum coccineum]
KDYKDEKKQKQSKTDKKREKDKESRARACFEVLKFQGPSLPKEKSLFIKEGKEEQETGTERANPP